MGGLKLYVYISNITRIKTPIFSTKFVESNYGEFAIIKNKILYG
jgi:hypothetical protein